MITAALIPQAPVLHTLRLGGVAGAELAKILATQRRLKCVALYTQSIGTAQWNALSSLEDLEFLQFDCEGTTDDFEEPSNEEAFSALKCLTLSVDVPVWLRLFPIKTRHPSVEVLDGGFHYQPNSWVGGQHPVQALINRINWSFPKLAAFTLEVDPSQRTRAEHLQEHAPLSLEGFRHLEVFKLTIPFTVHVSLDEVVVLLRSSPELRVFRLNTERPPDPRLVSIKLPLTILDAFAQHCPNINWVSFEPEVEASELKFDVSLPSLRHLERFDLLQVKDSAFDSERVSSYLATRLTLCPALTLSFPTRPSKVPWIWRQVRGLFLYEKMLRLRGQVPGSQDSLFRSLLLSAFPM